MLGTLFTIHSPYTFSSPQFLRGYEPNQRKQTTEGIGIPWRRTPREMVLRVKERRSRAGGERDDFLIAAGQVERRPSYLLGGYSRTPHSLLERIHGCSDRRR